MEEGRISNNTFILSLLTVFLLLFSINGFSQRSIGLDKKGKVKRLHFYEGTRIKIKLVDNERISGKIYAIYDSSFVIDGRKIPMSEVATVYSVRPTMRFIGGALMVSGAFYFTLDAVNNLLNYEARGYVFSNSVWAPAAIAVGSGLILYYFSTRRTKVYGKSNFRIFDTTPIPIQSDSALVDSTSTCDHGVEATLKILNLDGCNWVLELPDGKRLEPLNIESFFNESNIPRTTGVKVKVEYRVTKSASICMVGETVTVTCLEFLK